MSRPAKNPGNPYKYTVSVKMNDPGIELLDKMRGKMGRSEYFRELFRAQVQREKAQR